MSGQPTQPPTKNPKDATIYDVALRANVSIKTVSKVVNNLPAVSPTTRSRVLAAIEELAYRPNHLARNLATQGSRTLGLFCEEPSISCQYVASIEMGLLTACQHLGVRLSFDWMRVSHGDLPAHVSAMVNKSKLVAALLTPPLCDWSELIAAFKAAGIPLIRFSPTTKDAQCIDVDTDNRKAAYKITELLLSLGHRRIGYVHGRLGIADSHARFEGYRSALADAGIAFEDELCETGNNSYNSGIQCGEKLLSLKQRPTAIFASNDEMAVGVMAASIRHELRIPEDLSVAGFDDAVIAYSVSPRLTTCRQPIGQMVDAAIEHLIRRPEPMYGSITIPHKIIVRGSTAAPKS